MLTLEDLVSSLYKEKEDTWEAARRNAETFIKQAAQLADPDDNYLYSITSRIKRPERAVEKINAKVSKGKISSPDNLESLESSISDWIGIKVSCNTNADARALISIIEEKCGNPGYPAFSKKPDESNDIVNYIDEPKDSGYRAYHAVLIFHSFHDTKICDIPAEIQIKTRLQDSWGEITHDTSYKVGKSAAHPLHAEISKKMSDMLDAVDKKAEELAQKVAYETAEDSQSSNAASLATATKYTPASNPGEVVSVFHLDRRYALAKDHEGNVGLIRALWVRDLLAKDGKIKKEEMINVDEHLKINQKLSVDTLSEGDNFFYKPITLEDPVDLYQADELP